MTPLACNWSSNDLIWDSESCFLNSALIVLESVFTVRGRAGVRLFRSARIKSTSARVTLARGPRILRLTPRSGHWKSPFWLRTTRSFSLRLIRPKSRLMALQHATQFSSELLPPLVVAIKCSTLCASSTSFSLSNSSGAPDGVLRQKKRSRSETLGSNGRIWRTNPFQYRDREFRGLWSQFDIGDSALFVRCNCLLSSRRKFQAKRFRSFVRPTDQQISRLVMAVEESGDLLNENTKEQIRFSIKSF